MRPAHVVLVPLLALAALTSAPAVAAEWSLDPGQSVFAVLTHRAGLGARLAHDHLIVARGVSTQLRFDPADPAATRFDFSVPTLSLDVDPTAERRRWGPRLVELGALSGELPEIDADDRADVRKAMLAPGQLHAERFPTISAELDGLERRGSGAANARVALGWDARVRVSLHGRTIERVFPVRWEQKDGELTAEALGEFQFTEFDIEPYSAMLGAVRNSELFHIYVKIVAHADPGTGSPEEH